PTYPLLFYRQTYPEEIRISYPKAGEKNPFVSLHLYNLQTGEDLSLYEDSVGGYLPWFSWSPTADILYFVHLNRPQNRFTLYFYEVGRSTAPQIFLQDSTKGYFSWDNRQLIVWHPTQSELFYSALGEGGWEIRRYNAKGQKLSTYKIPGLREVIGCAEDRLFFQAAGRTPYYQRIGYISLSDKKTTPRWLTSDTTWAEGELAGGVLRIIESGLMQPYREFLCRASKPEECISLPDLNADLRTYRLPIQFRFVRFPGVEGDSLWGYILFPETLYTDRRYPVVLTFYGGPGSQQVSYAFKNISFYWQAYLVMRGYIVACADVRGTALYPEKRFSTYLRLGLLETEDLVAFVGWLRSLPYVGKIGAFGWSYGGYLAIRLAFAAPDGLAAAIAVAPPTNWRLYDTAYTERFMDTPQANPEGYQRTALPPPGVPLRVPLLIMHGDADDNVHVQNTYHFIEKLLRNQPDAPLEWRILPNQNHSLPQYRYRVYLEIEHFLDNFLKK
ncbi:MAG: prolyl oligopeptidase family serine peptidase, partial [Bacteroidia bacterium]|nr:prolyl oligopeptidase family serine peptidase [Bacteroidia bacterium]MDW8133709.1 prolyl oligopeptidase family serine peptidase [Bacteroidia bacterium]